MILTSYDHAEQRLMRVRGVTILAVVLAVLVGSSAAHAACDTGRNFGTQEPAWFDSWYRLAAGIPGGTLGYVGSAILEYSPYVAPTQAKESVTAWVMIQNDDVSNYYSQVGWIKTADGQRHSFSEWAYTDAEGRRQVAHREYIPRTIGNWTLYEVYWDPNAQRLQHWIDGVLYRSHIRYFTMRRADISGETHNYRSQMPGGFNYHEELTDSYVANLNDDIYEFGGSVRITDSSIHDWAGGSSTQLDIWDKACAT